MTDIVNLEDLNETHLKVARCVVAVDPKQPSFRETVRVIEANIVPDGVSVRPLPPPLEVVIDSTDPSQLRQLKEKVE